MKNFRVVVLFNGEETGIHISAASKAAARRCIGGHILRVEEILP